MIYCKFRNSEYQEDARLANLIDKSNETVTALCHLRFKSGFGVDFYWNFQRNGISSAIVENGV